MGIKERKARQKEGLRQDIMAAARELFARVGFENTSMRKLAEEIEYSPTTIYLHFKDKADLLDCVCEETLAQLESRMAELEASVADPVSRIRAGLRVYVDFGLEHPDDYRIAFLTERRTIAESNQYRRSEAMGQKAFDHVRTAVRRSVEAGRFAGQDVEATSQTLWAAIHGLTALLIQNPSFPWLDHATLSKHLIDTLVNGLTPPQHHEDHH